MDLETFNISQDDNESDTSQEDLDDDSVSAGYKAWSGLENHSKEIYHKWERGGCSASFQLNSSSLSPAAADEPLRFMLLDSDFSIISTAKIDPCISSVLLPESIRSRTEQSYNRLYGVTESGNSVLVKAFGFLPYFYALPSHGKFTPESIAQLEQALNAEIIKDVTSRLSTAIPYHDIVERSSPILYIELVNTSECNIYNFNQPSASYCSDSNSNTSPSTPENETTNLISEDDGNGACKTKIGKTTKKSKSKILKIYLSMPKFVWTAAKILNDNLIQLPVLNDKPCLYQTFEGSINHNIRFLTDLNLAGCSWLEIPEGKYVSRSTKSKLSHCQIEVDCHYKNVLSVSDESVAVLIPPLRILSFDIECMTRPPLFKFPRNGSERVLQIGSILATIGSPDIEKFVFMLGSCDELPGTQVYTFEDEMEMLEAWRLFVITTDPDILTGYNIKKFDLPFLLDRANVIKAARLPYLGRIKLSESETKLIQNIHKKPQRHDEKAVKMAGRIIFDMMILIMRHDTKPGGGYKLLDVSRRYLSSHETKEDVSYKDIFKLQNMGPSSRKTLASYCVQDSKLPYAIILEHNPNPAKNSNYNTLTYYIEKARLSGAPLRYLVTKSIEYNTHYKIIRKHKNPSVNLIPNTPARKPDKRRNSAPPFLIVDEEEPTNSSDSNGLSSAPAVDQKLCVKALFSKRSYSSYSKRGNAQK